MKWQQFKLCVIGIAITVLCGTVSLFASAILAPYQAKTASISFFSALTEVLNSMPFFLFCIFFALVAVLIKKGMFLYYDVRQYQATVQRSFFENNRIRFENDRIQTDTIVEQQRLLLPEGGSALVGPVYDQYRQVYNPRAPRIQKITQEDDTQQDEPQLLLPGPYTLSSIPGWMPIKGKLFLGKTADRDIIIKAKDAWHIALAGPTGGGKSNALMNLLLQLVPFYQCFMVNPHWTPVEDKLDWRPIEEHLVKPVIYHESKYEDFFTFLIKTMEYRYEMRRLHHISYAGDPIFVSIDEYPSIVAKWKKAPEIIGRLVREARKVYIFIILCSQDLLLSTIGGNSGARECYRTAFGFNGDNTTMGVIVDDWTKRKKEINTALLGKDGRCVLRSFETLGGEEVRVPEVDEYIIEAVFSGHVRPDERMQDIVQDETDADEQPYSMQPPHSAVWEMVFQNIGQMF